MAGKPWPTVFSIELFVYLLRFAAQEPAAPPRKRGRLLSLARCYAKKYAIPSDSAEARQFSAVLRGEFLAEGGAQAQIPSVSPGAEPGNAAPAWPPAGKTAGMKERAGGKARRLAGKKAVIF